MADPNPHGGVVQNHRAKREHAPPQRVCEGELQAAATVKEFLIVRQEGNRQVSDLWSITTSTPSSPSATALKAPLPPAFAFGDAKAARIHRKGVCARRRAAEESRPTLRLF